MVDFEFLSNDEYKKLTEKGTLTVVYGFHESPFGTCLIAAVRNKVCHLSFSEKGSPENLNELRKEWPGAILEENQKNTFPLAGKIFGGGKDSVEILCKGSEFQESVWRELSKIPEGKTWSYEEVAKNLGKPTATRACARAVATNPVSYLIPCHRVIKKSGRVHKYRWGCKIKEKLLAAETGRADASGG